MAKRNDVEVLAQPVEKAVAPPLAGKPAGKAGGFCVYLGPTIRGSILHGDIFNSNKAAVLAQLSSIVKDYPIVADLMIPGDALPEARDKAGTPGNYLYERYKTLEKAL